MLLRRGEADGLLCGTVRRLRNPPEARRRTSSAESRHRHAGGDEPADAAQAQTVFIADTYINENPTAAQIAEIALLAAEAVRRFGVTPRVALLSHSSFGSARTASAAKMREALGLIQARAPDLEAEGEMQGDAALNKGILDGVFPDSRLTARKPTCW